MVVKPFGSSGRYLIMRRLSFRIFGGSARLCLIVLALVLAGCGSQVAAGDPDVTTTTTMPVSTTTQAGSVSSGDDELSTTSSTSEVVAEPADDDGDADDDESATDESDSGEESASDNESPLEDGSTTTTEAAVTTTTSTTAAPAETAGNPELDSLIAELAAYVETERGLEFLRQPEVRLLDEDEFAQAWLDLINDDAQENGADFANFTDIYQTMGIISDDLSLQEIWLRFGEAGVLGYYETDIGAIRLRNGDINALTRTTLVHELVHALEDQHFGLDRDEYADREDEISWAFSALIEGSARVIENRYRSTYTASELDEENAARRAIPRSVSLAEFESSFLELQFGRYNYGTTLANELWADGGSAAVDRAFQSPPSSSEQVLKPELYVGRVTPDAPLSAPPADGVVFEEGVWGEAAWAAILSDSDSLAGALRVADGWGGDWFVAWRDGSQTCVRIDVSADSANELGEYENAIDEWTRLGDGRELESIGSDVLRLTVCEG